MNSGFGAELFTTISFVNAAIKSVLKTPGYVLTIIVDGKSLYLYCNHLKFYHSVPITLIGSFAKYVGGLYDNHVTMNHLYPKCSF